MKDLITLKLVGGSNVVVVDQQQHQKQLFDHIKQCKYAIAGLNAGVLGKNNKSVDG
jgi:hypothetical protein